MRKSLTAILASAAVIVSLSGVGAEFVDTCQDIHSTHATLFATCTNAGGQLEPSSLDLTTCLAYTNGQLVCDDDPR